MYNFLIADDEDEIRISLKNYLKNRLNCNVVELLDGGRVLEAFDEKTFDLIFLDIRMPVKNGLEVLSEIRSKDKDIPVIVISGWDSAEISEDIKKLNAFYLSKPISLKILFEKAKEILGIPEEEIKNV